jgi:hypothetical protein
MTAPSSSGFADEGALLRAAAANIAPPVNAAVVEVLTGMDVRAGVVAVVDGPVARCMAVTSAGFVLIEVSQTLDRLVVACPLWRVSRVAELSSNNTTSVVVEIDADRSFVRPASDGSSVVVPCSYELSMPTQQAGDLSRFAAAFRQLLLAD